MHTELDELMRHHGPALFARALRLTRNRADAWDLLQDSLERMLTRCPDRSSTDAMQRWLSVIMRNLSTDRYRAARRHRRVELSEVMLRCEPAEPAEEPFWVSVDAGQVERCVALLEPRLREAYRLRVEQRLSLAVAAQVLGVPVATVGTRVHRARRRLRVLLETAGGQAPEAGDGP